MQQQPVDNNGGIKITLSRYSGIDNPECALGTAGCMLGCYLGKPVECCVIGCCIGCLYGCLNTTKVTERIIINSVPEANRIYRD